MRLAYLVSQYPAINHTFILREIRALRRLGLELHVISIRPPDRPLDELSEEEREEALNTFTVLAAGVGHVLAAHLATMLRRPAAYFGGMLYALRLARLDFRKAFANLLYFGEAVVVGRRLLARALRHVHTHFSSTVALLAARVFPLTFSTTIHGPDEFTDVAGFYIPEKVARAAFLCAISQYGLSQLMKASDPRHWHKLEVCPLGVDPSLFQPRPHRDNPEPFQILCVGRLAPAKAQQVLIKAVDRLRRQGRAVCLRLVGDGPERPRLETLIADRGLRDCVRLEGFCDQERVRAFYRDADLFALPSFAEGLPVVLMEAMAMEIPCVATGITGIPELIRHGIDGWLVPPADEEQLAAAIAHLMDDPALRRQLGQSARARILHKYHLERNTERLAGIYRRRLASSAS